TGEIQRVGSDRRLPTLDVRVITATHRHLVDHIADKTFREDLYYRLNVIHITVPPLRERREDIFLLLNHFLNLFSETHRIPLPEVKPDAVQALTAYRWPGNVRELRNVAERLVLRCRNGFIDLDTLPVEILEERRAGAAAASVPAAAAVLPQHKQLFDRLM